MVRVDLPLSLFVAGHEARSLPYHSVRGWRRQRWTKSVTYDLV